ncbi:MAG: catalase family peroxidase [Aeromonas veronii]
MTVPTLAQDQNSLTTLPALTADGMVDALNGTFGKHAGARASHAKGLCIRGQFTPHPDAGQLTKAALFLQSSLDVFGRFSIGGGNPNISDKSRSVRGLAIRISHQLENYDLVLISEPVFFAATPESFVGFLQARVADPTTGKPNPDLISIHNQRFPDGKAQPALLATHAAPSSYACTPYYSTHAFGFQNSQGDMTWARLKLIPVAGTCYLDEEQEANYPDRFLNAELHQRLQLNTVEFELVAQHHSEGDSLEDPSTQWYGKKYTSLGRLSITAISDEAFCEPITFIPTNLPSGIEASDDPILKARAAAYAVSLARRRTK